MWSTPNRPTEPPRPLRNLASRGAKRLVGWFASGIPTDDFHSYRLLLGEVARSVAAYAGPDIYLDVAVSWVARRTTTSPVEMRREGDRPSGYHLRSLLSHFWRLVPPAGPSRCALSGHGSWLFTAGNAVGAGPHRRTPTNQWAYPGWTSTMLMLMFATGLILFSLGVIAEYVGRAVNMAMGKPLYLPCVTRRMGRWGATGDDRTAPLCGWGGGLVGRQVVAAGLTAGMPASRTFPGPIRAQASRRWLPTCDSSPPT